MPDVKPTPSLRFMTHPRPRSTTRGIVVHHTAGNPNQSVEDIHAYHLRIDGWIGVGYNLVQTAAESPYRRQSAAQSETSDNHLSTGTGDVSKLPVRQMPIVSRL